MQPTERQYEQSISAVVERWKAKCKALREADRETDHADSWKMTALRMRLCGEIQKIVEHSETQFETCHELRDVFLKWAINGKIEEERSMHDPVDCDQSQNLDPARGTQQERNWRSIPEKR